MSYASGTQVSVERTKAQIEQMVMKRGATKFATMVEDNRALIAFSINGRTLHFSVVLPRKDDDRFTTTPTGRRRKNSNSVYAAWEMECRRVWRALLAVIKAKFIAVDDGVYTFEEAFLTDIVMGDGKTVGQSVIPKVTEYYETGKVVPLLPPV